LIFWKKKLQDLKISGHFDLQKTLDSGLVDMALYLCHGSRTQWKYMWALLKNLGHPQRRSHPAIFDETQSLKIPTLPEPQSSPIFPT
jgi:hypothetical protein